MKKIVPLIAILSTALWILPKIEAPLNEEQQAIKEVVEEAYLQGLQNEGDTLKIDAGFHPQFVMIGRNKAEQLWHYPIKEWRQSKIERKAQGELPLAESKKVSGTFESIDIEDDVAMVKLHYFEGGMHTYTDFIALYKIKGEWKIISKVFTKIKA